MSGVLTLPSGGSTRAIIDFDPSPESLLKQAEREIIQLVHDERHREAVALTARAYGPKLHRFFARWQQRDAEDLVQDVLVRVYEAFRRGRFRGHLRFAAWLFKIAGNLRIDVHRKSARQQALLTRHAPCVRRDVHGIRRDTAWDSLSTHEQRMWLADAIHTLDHDDQLLLGLRFDAGLSWNDVSAVLKIRTASAKRRFTELRRDLADRWTQ